MEDELKDPFIDDVVDEDADALLEDDLVDEEDSAADWVDDTEE